MKRKRTSRQATSWTFTTHGSRPSCPPKPHVYQKPQVKSSAPGFRKEPRLPIVPGPSYCPCFLFASNQMRRHLAPLLALGKYKQGKGKLHLDWVLALRAKIKRDYKTAATQPAASVALLVINVFNLNLVPLPTRTPVLSLSGCPCARASAHLLPKILAPEVPGSFGYRGLGLDWTIFLPLSRPGFSRSPSSDYA